MFLLVPAHPGCPGQIPQSRKTVVLCVCVCVINDRSGCKGVFRLLRIRIRQQQFTGSGTTLERARKVIEPSRKQSKDTDNGIWKQ